MEILEFIPVESVLDIYDINGNLVKQGDEVVTSIILHNDSTESLSTFEGKKKLFLHFRKERDVVFMKKCKDLYAKKDPLLSCEACGFSFQKAYGDIGKSFIEGHHTKPISGLTRETKISIDDIKMVCSNCHSMIHSKYPCYTIEEIKKLITENLSNVR
ncbi:HNH endonuclease [Paenibacillus lutrae]|uniref:HNH domain-containing protein n=1 Tax=Paenibacillus lutrae TaxID=2078573 RepID=A0A7X3FIW9_9BACL|nr:HNH endonuclease [Paenibacillus lutrae]MVP00553.1 hypothetical protein [Paenibacillus lutrae]